MLVLHVATIQPSTEHTVSTQMHCVCRAKAWMRCSSATSAHAAARQPSAHLLACCRRALCPELPAGPPPPTAHTAPWHCCLVPAAGAQAQRPALAAWLAVAAAAPAAPRCLLLHLGSPATPAALQLPVKGVTRCKQEPMNIPGVVLAACGAAQQLRMLAQCLLLSTPKHPIWWPTGCNLPQMCIRACHTPSISSM